MKKVKVEVETTLTYCPFENLSDILKKDKTQKKEDNGKEGTDGK